MCGKFYMDEYNYLDKGRYDSAWKRAKDVAKEHGVQLLVDIVK